MNGTAQGTVEQKSTDKEADRFICLGTNQLGTGISAGTKKIDIPAGAEYVRARKRKVNFYAGTKPEPNGYARIPEGATAVSLPHYSDRVEHAKYGEFMFEYGPTQQ